MINKVEYYTKIYSNCKKTYQVRFYNENSLSNVPSVKTIDDISRHRISAISQLKLVSFDSSYGSP